MENNEGQPIQPEGEALPLALPPHRIAELVGNGPIRDYRTIPRDPIPPQQIMHGDEPLYCVPMNTCMIFMSVIFTGTIFIALIVLLATETTTHIPEFDPHPTAVPKYY